GVMAGAGARAEGEVPETLARFLRDGSVADTLVVDASGLNGRIRSRTEVGAYALRQVGRFSVGAGLRALREQELAGLRFEGPATLRVTNDGVDATLLAASPVAGAAGWGSALDLWIAREIERG